MADPITDAEVAELRRLHEAATPGPLTYFLGNANGRGLVRVETAAEAPTAGAVLATATRDREADVAAMIAARNALPGLLARLEQAERERDEAMAVSARLDEAMCSLHDTETSLRSRIATLESVLGDVLDFCTDPDDANESFERIGRMYLIDTGFLRPGKADPFSDTSDAASRERFDEWARRKWKGLHDRARAALRGVEGK